MGVGADESSGEYQNANLIGTGVSTAEAVISGAATLVALRGAAKLTDDAAEMVYHGTTASETVTTIGLDEAANIAAAGGKDFANFGFSVTTRLDDARGFAIGRSLLRSEEPVVLGARKADLDHLLRDRIPGTTLDIGELRILPKDFHKVGAGVFRRIE